jgi:DNA-directed RNA polymerase
MTSEKNEIIQAFSKLSDAEKEVISENQALRKEIKVAKNKLRMFDSMLIFSEVFAGFPLYFTNFLDYRTRCYPLEFL